MLAQVGFLLVGGLQPLILLPVSVNERGPYQFVLDTGAGLSLVTPELAEHLGVPVTDTKEGMGAAGRITVKIGQVEKLAVEEAAINDLQVAITSELEKIGKVIGTQIDGVLGYNFLCHFAIKIDYRDNKICFTVAKAAELVNAIKFELAHAEKPLIIVNVRANGTGPHSFVLDTGASTTVLSRELADRLSLETTDIAEMTGGGGKVSASVGTIAQLAIGEQELRNVDVAIVDFLPSLSEIVGIKLDGIVGYNFLKEFVVTIDYGHEMVLLG